MRMLVRGLVPAVSLLLFLPIPASSQESAAPAQATSSQSPSAATPTNWTAPASAPAVPLSSTHDHLISLDVVVTDQSGNPVSGLTPQDFTLLDGKLPQPIVSFRATEEGSKDAEPIQVLFLIDGVNSGVQSVSIGREQLEKFLRRNNGQLELPTSLAIFGDKGAEVQPVATRDGNKLAQDLDSNPSGLRSIGRSAGYYGATERLDLSLRTLEGLIAREMKRPGRKLLIWMSPGWPLLTSARIQLTEKDQAWIFNTAVSFSKELREARMTLYGIDPLGMSDAVTGRTTFWQGFVKGLPSANKVEGGGHLALQVLAIQSGGLALNSSNDLEKLIASCVVDAKAYYTLSFEAPPADRSNEYHSLEVKVDKPGLKVRTRTGYYAQPYPTNGR
jgi:VWFA-related protein